jgi:hypothetical protein
MRVDRRVFDYFGGDKAAMRDALTEYVNSLLT